jgi:hypothetical protein
MEDSGAVEVEKVTQEAQDIEKESGRALDGKRVGCHVAEARGIPEPIW